MSNITPADLADIHRLRGRIHAAIKAGMIEDTELSRLNCVAAAERALRTAGKNPCGLFARIVRGKRWDWLDSTDIDRANERIKRWRAENPGPLPPAVADVAKAMTSTSDPSPSEGTPE